MVMGLFKRKKKNDKKEETLAELGEQEDSVVEMPLLSELRMEQTEAGSKEECMEYIKNHCELILEALRNLEEERKEYASISGLLMDIQRIDRMEDKKILTDVARQLITLNRAIENFEGRKISITPAQYQRIQTYEEEMPSQIRRMEEEEQHYMEIKSDLRYLKEEQQNIQKKKKLLLGKQGYLKRLAVVTVILMVILCALFFSISIVFENDMTIPYMLSVALAAVSGTYIFLEGRKNRMALGLEEKKGHRTIQLSNKVKIKYVNSTNLLDYYYEKYGVESVEELRYQFKEYQKAKEAAQRNQKNTQRQKQCQETLKSELLAIGVSDCDIWLHQLPALLDDREMVEVRHKLNQGRQKLREQMEIQEDTKEESITQIREFLENHPDYKPAMIKVLGDYKIIL